MGRKRKGSNKKGEEKLRDAVSDEDGEGPQGMDDLYDEVDMWDQEQDQEAAAVLSRGGRSKETGNMEMYALSGNDSDSDLELPKVEKKKKKKKEKNKVLSAREAAEAEIEMNDEDFLGSDADQADEDDNLRAWGSKKKHFYGGNTGYQMATSDSEYSEDEAEEKEARLLQERQMDRLQEEDFMDAFGVDLSSKTDKDDSKEEVVEETVAPDLTKLSSKELAKLFRQQAPEFDGIVQDFKQRIAEAIKLAKIVQLEDQGLLPSGPVTEYVRFKFQILTNYCTNISAYLMFKSKGTNLKLHPVVGRLVEYKHLLDSLQDKDAIVQPQVDSLLSRLSSGQNIEDIVKEEKRRLKKKAKKKKKTSTLKLLENKNVEENSVVDNEKTGVKRKHEQRALEDLTGDEKMAVELYQAIKRNKGAEEEESEEENDEVNEASRPENASQPHAPLDEEVDLELDGQKRGITYQIAKNKGLTPKRSKLQRNPRVKHRVKFEQAKKRRKGAVREIRKETTRYGGEFSGINARVKKGVKLQ